MKPTLGPAFDANYTGRPPHMSPLDTALWHTLRPTLPPPPTKIYFDVQLGTGRDAPEGTDDNAAQMWLTLNRKRADIVVDHEAGWTIVELRAHAQLNAVGRLLGYKLLWISDPPDTRPLALALYTDALDNDVRQLCAQVGIAYAVI